MGLPQRRRRRADEGADRRLQHGASRRSRSTRPPSSGACPSTPRSAPRPAVGAGPGRDDLPPVAHPDRARREACCPRSPTRTWRTPGVTKADFFPRSIEAAIDNGQLYAVPFDIHAVVLYYNKNAARGDALPRRRRQADRHHEPRRLQRRAEGAEGQGRRDPALASPPATTAAPGGCSTRSSPRRAASSSTNGEVLPGDNAAKAVKAIQIMTDWRSADYTPEQTEYPASVALFTAGDAAFHMQRRLGGPDLHRPRTPRARSASTGARR